MKSAPISNPACGRVQGRLAELVDGGLTPLEEARDRGHLEACAACASAADDWLAFHTELKAALPSVELPADLVPGLAARLEAVRIAPPAGRAGAWTSLLAAAASLVLLFGFEALGTAMERDSAGSLFAPGIELPGPLAGAAGLLPKDLADGVFTDLRTESAEDPQ